MGWTGRVLSAHGQEEISKEQAYVSSSISSAHRKVVSAYEKRSIGKLMTDETAYKVKEKNKRVVSRIR